MKHPFKNKGDIKTFQDKQKLREFIITTLISLQEMLKKVIYSVIKDIRLKHEVIQKYKVLKCNNLYFWNFGAYINFKILYRM